MNGSPIVPNFDSDLTCDIINVLMTKGCYRRQGCQREEVLRFAGSGHDRDVVEQAIDRAIKLPFVGHVGSERIRLYQIAELVHFLVEECNREPEFFKAHLHHIPPHVWAEYSVTPPNP